jgi:high-affinity Fe2+/Pb2+ permease
MAENEATANEAKTIITTEQVKIRRTPKFLEFILTGAVLGVIIALIVGFSIPEEQRTAEPIVTYLIAYFAGFGAAAGVVLAVILDWIFSKRAKQLEATKLEA